MVSTRSQSTNPLSAPPMTSPSSSTSPAPAPTTRQPWAHTPSNLTLLWLLVSLPLVVWDTLYVLLRPHSMAGGALHSPLWTPYALYGRVDYNYGWPAYDAHDGFTAAQSALNIVETLFYAYYLWLVYSHGRPSAAKGRGAPAPSTVGWLGEAKVVAGKVGGVAVLVGFSSAVMTVSKTVLYWLNEHFSGYASIGHNDFSQLLWLWIVPNGAWIVFPSYMVYVFGREILQGLGVASGTGGSEEDDIARKER